MTDDNGLIPSDKDNSSGAATHSLRNHPYDLSRFDSQHHPR